MKTIITGGAGFIGSNFVKFLLKKNWKVVVIDNFSVGKKENLPKNKSLRIVTADVCDKNKMLSTIKNCDYVFHLATQCVRESINNPRLVHKVNTEGTLNVLEAARRNKIKKFVYVSSSEVYGTAVNVPMTEKHLLNPTTIYGASKLAGEYYTLSYLRTYGLHTVIVRPFNTYGYNSHFEGAYGEVIPRFVIRALNNLSLQIFGDGKQTRDFTFVEDVVKGIYLVGKKGKIGEVYNIARGKEVSVNELARLIPKALSVEVEKEYLIDRPGDVRRHFSDIKKAKRELGFKPKTEIQEGLRKYIRWFLMTYENPRILLKHYEEKNW